MPLNAAAAVSELTPARALEETIEGYYQTNQEYILDDWEELLAVYAAGEDLRDYVLPATPTSGSSAVLVSLIKGEMESAYIAANSLVSEGVLVDGGYSYYQALNMIAIEAYNRAASVTDGYSKIYYDKQASVDVLLADIINVDINEETHKAFNDYDSISPSADGTGMSLVALSLYSDCVGVEAAIDSATAYLHAVQNADGGFNYSYSEDGVLFSFYSSNTTSAVIWGIIAIGENPDSITWQKSGKSPVDALLEQSYNTNGGFGDYGSVNAYSTKQSTLAIAEAVMVNSLVEQNGETISKCSVFNTLSINSKQ